MISCENEDTSYSTVQQTLIQSTDLSYYEQYDALFILLLNAMTTDIYYLRITILADYIHKKKTQWLVIIIILLLLLISFKRIHMFVTHLNMSL